MTLAALFGGLMGLGVGRGGGGPGEGRAPPLGLLSFQFHEIFVKNLAK